LSAPTKALVKPLGEQLIPAKNDTSVLLLIVLFQVFRYAGIFHDSDRPVAQSTKGQLGRKEGDRGSAADLAADD
jgi:hypothetical protein